MKKHELLKYLDNGLLDKLFGFSYARTNDSYEAQDLCSDIIFALIKAANTEGEITNVYSFIWKVARNVYADFSNGRENMRRIFYDGNADDILLFIEKDESEDNSEELLNTIYKEIAFLSKAYREVMILYYIEGLSTAEIAIHQNTSEGAVRQRLFSARQIIKSEVNKMAEMNNKPILLDKVEYVIWGSGDPAWGDPREVFSRTFSKHILWLCRKKAMSAVEIAEQLNVPTIYVEEELEILANGVNGKYGLLRRTNNGKYIINFVLLDKDVIEKAHALYEEQIPNICNTICDFIADHKPEYLAFPYLNKTADLNLILWQQVFVMANAFSSAVMTIMREEYFSQIKDMNYPFTVFGYVDNGKHYGGGWDGVDAQNICGFSKVHFDNIYITRINAHFHCGLNASKDIQLQLALRAINGLNISTLSETEKEHAAKAIESGYLYRDEEVLYTKILVSKVEDMDRLFDISKRLHNGYFEKEAHVVAEKLYALIKKVVPEYLYAEWQYVNVLAGLPVLDSLVEVLIERGILMPPKDGIGAEGCWMSVMK